MPRIHDAAARRELVARVRRLTPGSERRWGHMTVDQMLWHLNTAMEMYLGRQECGRLDNLFKRTLLKAVALYGPWPKGKAPTAPELKANGRYDLAAEQDRFERLAEEVGGKDVAGPWARHPAFGPMSGRQYSRLAWRHANHHLTQFSV